ncbi:hypothetical protein ACSBR2_015895 [Camellia fascicularis]
MSHEYAMGGLFLEKSDVFSFGVLLVEMDYVADRPTMSTVVLMLSHEKDLPHLKQPTFTIQGLSDADFLSQCNKIFSLNKASLSIIEGR